MFTVAIVRYNGVVWQNWGWIISWEDYKHFFPEHQLAVFVGSLLGDGRLECRSVGVRGPRTARFRVHHGHKQSDYVHWKYEQLKAMCGKGPREITRFDRKRDIEEVSWYFHTKSTQSLGVLHEVFYHEGKKILPQVLEKLLTPEALAIWYMDDGCLTLNSVVLNTHSFSKEEHEYLQRYFAVMHGLITTIVRDRSQVKLRIGASQYQHFLNIIKPFIIPTMTYKLVYPRNDLCLPKSGSEYVLQKLQSC